MRLIQLIASNVKRLVAVAIRPTGELIEIAGPNAAGKSSILDSIWFGIVGERDGWRVNRHVPIPAGLAAVATRAECRRELQETMRRRAAAGRFVTPRCPERASDRNDTAGGPVTDRATRFMRRQRGGPGGGSDR